MKKVIVDARGSFAGGGVEILLSFATELERRGFGASNTVFLISADYLSSRIPFPCILAPSSFSTSLYLSVILTFRFGRRDTFVFSWGIPKIFGFKNVFCLLHNTISFERIEVLQDFPILDRLRFFLMRSNFLLRLWVRKFHVVLTSRYFYNLLDERYSKYLPSDLKTMISFFEAGSRVEVDWNDIKELNFRRPLKIVSVSAFSPHKRIPVMVQVVEKLAENGFPIEYSNYSYKNDPRIMSKIEKLMRKSLVLNDSVIKFYFGREKKEIMAALSDADIVFCLSTTETGPLALKEALACNSLIVATADKFISEFVELPPDCVAETFTVDSVYDTVFRLFIRFYKMRGYPQVRAILSSRCSGRSYSSDVLEQAFGDC